MQDMLDDSEHSIMVCAALLRVIDKLLGGSSSLDDTDKTGVDPHRFALVAHVKSAERRILEHQKRELLQLMMALTMSEGESEEDM